MDKIGRSVLQHPKKLKYIPNKYSINANILKHLISRGGVVEYKPRWYHHILQLEKYGYVEFDRKNKKLKLTPLGYEVCRQMLIGEKVDELIPVSRLSRNPLPLLIKKEIIRRGIKPSNVNKKLVFEIVKDIIRKAKHPENYLREMEIGDILFDIYDIPPESLRKLSPDTFVELIRTESNYHKKLLNAYLYKVGPLQALKPILNQITDESVKTWLKALKSALKII